MPRVKSRLQLFICLRPVKTWNKSFREARSAGKKQPAYSLGTLGIPNTQVCSTWLAKFFQDSDSDVRAAAADCFRNLPSNLLSNELKIISDFIDSPACIDNSHQLIHPLEESTERLPDMICRVPERLIAEHRSATPTQNFESRRWIYHLPALVARLYEQSADADIKRRCLDIIDGMLELHVSEIEKELEQVER